MKQGASPRQEMHVRCCIVGGGAAGMVLGFLFARAGVPDHSLTGYGVPITQALAAPN
jgi:cation diffusion facilitator CzcD-associated flavoprotein CzcO